MKAHTITEKMLTNYMPRAMKRSLLGRLRNSTCIKEGKNPVAH